MEATGELWLQAAREVPIPNMTISILNLVLDQIQPNENVISVSCSVGISRLCLSSLDIVVCYIIVVDIYYLDT
jgi:hypothetical protein